METNNYIVINCPASIIMRVNDVGELASEGNRTCITSPSSRVQRISGAPTMTTVVDYWLGNAWKLNVLVAELSLLDWDMH